VEYLLENPVYYALLYGDKEMGFGTGKARYFDEDISPFAGFEESNGQGFNELFQLLPAGRKILYATPHLIAEPNGWQLLNEIKGLQFILDTSVTAASFQFEPVPLGKENIEEMVQLAALTKPGPFGKRTIEFGHYYGIFRNGKLVAMTGQRLHVNSYTEISAVCTHPEYTGRGFAAALVQHQVQLIHNHRQVPFLHVREDNVRAVALYKRLGFGISRPMNFYFLKRKN
jgi:ribosomal protein S18 acetylase RimI-like enzyme